MGWQRYKVRFKNVAKIVISERKAISTIFGQKLYRNPHYPQQPIKQLFFRQLYFKITNPKKIRPMRQFYLLNYHIKLSSNSIGIIIEIAQ